MRNWCYVTSARVFQLWLAEDYSIFKRLFVLLKIKPRSDVPLTHLTIALICMVNIRLNSELLNCNSKY